MSPSEVNRAIATAVAPLRLAERAKARAAIEQGLAAASPEQRFTALSGFDSYADPSVGGGSPLLRWWRPGVRDAAGDTLIALRMQRGQSRDLARTHPLAAGAINTNVDRTVGTGLALVASPNRDVLGWSSERLLVWKKKAQIEFSLYADSPECDVAGEQNFYEKQCLTLRASLESGDCFTVLPDGDATSTQPYRLRIQTIEADRVGNPNATSDTAEIAAGVRRALGSAAASSYFLYDVHPGAIFIGTGQSRFTGQWIDRVGPSGRRRILHHFRQLRPEQPRGVPYLAPVVECIKQLGRYTEAEIQAAIVSAFFTVIVETETGTSPAPIFGALQPGPGDGTSGPTGDNEIAMGPAAVIGLAKGEKASFANPVRPNSAFEPFVQAIVKQIGVGLNMPYELLVKQFNASYSASRAALLDAWLWFKSQRTWLARSFCQPVYETWMAEAVATGRIAAPGFFTDPLMRWAYTRAEWHGDSQGSINPKDEVAAYLAAVDGRIMTRERAEWELGGTDWYETFDAKKTEQELLKAADLLPMPKAGAPAPAGTDAQPSQNVDNSPGALEASFASMAASVALIAAREPGQIHMHQAPIEITQGDTHAHVTLPEGCIQLEATVQAPSVTVEPAVVNLEARIDVPPPVVTMMPASATRQVITRDAQGEIAQIVTEPTQQSGTP